MPCYHPLPAWRARSLGASGKRGITFNFQEAFSDLDHQVEVPCGQCIGCRTDSARQWTIRCLHEAKSHQISSFVTLTYAPENVPPGGSLRPIDIVLFLKRLRNSHGPFRYFQCGEYGERLERPHHHALLFGVGFPDRKLHSGGDMPLYRSSELERLWPHGFSTIGDVTEKSCAYCTAYILKKVGGPKAAEHYRGRKPEYVTMSRRPGLGTTWWLKYGRTVARQGSIVLLDANGGREVKFPRFYDQLIRKTDGEKLLRSIKKARKQAAIDNPDCTPRALIRRGDVREALAKQGPTRSYEK